MRKLDANLTLLQSPKPFFLILVPELGKLFTNWMFHPVTERQRSLENISAQAGFLKNNFRVQ